MPIDIIALLTRNLHEVFGEGDDARRRAVVEEIFTEDATFHEPSGVHRGRDDIARIAGVIRSFHPDYIYTVTRPPEQLDDTAGRIQWVSGQPGKPAAYAGTDIGVVRDGRIAAIYLFFDRAPPEAG